MIGILDSGVGGLSIYRSIKDRLPGARIIYLADKKNFPYGEKSEAELAIIVHDAVMKLIEHGAYVVVVACNSATVSTIDALRRRFDVPIIGVEPAIKQAASDLGVGKIGIIATARTIANHEAGILAGGCKLIKSHNGELVEKIENHYSSITDEDLLAAMEPFTNENVSSVVLGCTHFHFIKHRLERLLPNIHFYAPEEEVTSRLLTVMNEKSIGLEGGDDIFLVTAGADDFRESLYSLLEMSDANIREV